MVEPHITQQYLERISLIHYQIKGIIYNSEVDRFYVQLASYFKGWPTVDVNISYYKDRDSHIAVAFINDDYFKLATATADYIEGIVSEVIDRINDVLKGHSYGSNEKPKRLSIFGPS